MSYSKLYVEFFDFENNQRNDHQIDFKCETDYLQTIKPLVIPVTENSIFDN